MTCCSGLSHGFVWCGVGNHGPVSVNSRSANLTAGFHSIEVDYCNMGGPAALSLSWKGPNDTAYSVRVVPCKPQLEPSILPRKIHLLGYSKRPSTMTRVCLYCVYTCIYVYV